MRLKVAEIDDAPAVFDHLQRHFAESGKDGDPIFHPSPGYVTWKKEAFCEDLVKGWQMPITQNGWERAWLLTQNGLVVGHSDLRGSKLLTSSHRCTFGIGLERSARGHGFGKALSMAAITWAKMQPGLDWIDLFVFGGNQPAQALYSSVGFERVGAVKDQFRVNGVSIDDIHMVLGLR